MKNLKESYKYINKYLSAKGIDNETKFVNLFMLICHLIDTISFGDEKNRKHILKMLKEYDFDKNKNE